MLMRYEIKYGIRKYVPGGDDDAPFDFIEYNEPESILINDLLHQRLQQHVNLSIYRHTGIDFETFMNMQRIDVLAVIKVAEKKCQAEEASANNLEDKLKGLSQT